MTPEERLIGAINAQAIKDYVKGLEILNTCGRFTDPQTKKNFRSAEIWLQDVRPDLLSELARYTNNGTKKKYDLSDKS